MALALQGKLRTALVCLLFSGLCDMYDGTYAATIERSEVEKKFGIQIDSLCDVVCFSTFPAVMAYSVAGPTALCLVSMVLIVLCGVIRLGYFNVQEELRQQETTESRKHYQGLPVTSSAIIVPVGVLVFHLASLRLELALPLLNICIACANVVDFKMAKPQRTGKLVLVGIGLVTFAAIWLAWRAGQ